MNWDKVKLIIGREYLTRVRNKTFILGTILTPIGIVLLSVISGLIMSHQGNESYKIAVRDEAGALEAFLKDSKRFDFEFPSLPKDSLIAGVKTGRWDGLLVVPALDSLTATEVRLKYYTDRRMGLDLSEALKDKIAGAFRQYKLAGLHLDESVLKRLNTSISIDPEPVGKQRRNYSEWTEGVAAAIGGAMGFFMYMVVFIYGMMVMRSAMEEKTSRIVEVIMTGVKPFELMLGKLLGVGAVGLTQLAIWIVLIIVFSLVGSVAMGHSMTGQIDPEVMRQIQTSSAVQANVTKIMQELSNINWWLILPMFLFYFLGGFFLYAALFIAVGSAVGDDVGESQSLTLPIVLPVIIAIYIMFSVLRDPNTDLAVWASIFPLFSPIVMPARLPYDPPSWQIAASALALIVGVWFFVWLAARIYRVGILMYGKKATYKELLKWLRQS